MKSKLIILGCGNSSGVPAIGNRWGDCDPNEPKNRRTRCSAAIQNENSTIIIDTGPDFRNQYNALLGEVKLDGVLYTHSHGDHVNGIDDLRIFRFKQDAKIPAYANKESIDDMIHRFPYIFAGGNHALYPEIIDIHEVKAEEEGALHSIGSIEFIPFSQDHGTCATLGFRFGDTAYSADIYDLDKKAIDTLKGIKNWVVDAGAYHQHNNPVHATIEKIYEFNEKIGAKHVYLTSLSVLMDYQTMCDELKDGYIPAHDGLIIEVNP